MSFSFDERPDSRATGYDPPQITLRYNAVGERDQQIVEAYAFGTGSPVSMLTEGGLLWRQDIQVQPVGHAFYIVSVPYGPKKKSTGEWTFNFDTTGATVKVKVAREHVKSYPVSGAGGANPHKGAIGVKPDGDVEGVEIVIPALKLNAQYKHPEGTVTIGYAKNLARATGCTNSEPFMTFAAGELLFLGAQGADGTDAPAEVNYQFAASENVTNLSFGDITDIVKAGHAYAWVEFKDDIDGGEHAAVQPRRVHVERVYNAVPFADILGWGSV